MALVAHIENVASLVHFNLGPLGTLLPRVWRVKDARQLLERLPGCLHGEEVDDDNLDKDPDAVDDIWER